MGLSDKRPIQKESGDWVAALNMLLDDGFSKINEKSFDRVWNITYNQVCGVIMIPNGAVVLSTNRVNGVVPGGGTAYSKIERFTHGDPIGQTIINTRYFTYNESDGFDLYNPIEGVFKKLNSGDIIIVFGGDNVTPRLINIDTLPFEVNWFTQEIEAKTLPDGTTVTEESLGELTLLFPKYNTPLISLDSVAEEGGNTETGMYQFTLAYNISKGIETSCCIPSTRIKVAPTSRASYNLSSLEFNYNNFDSGELVDCIINLQITELDTKYDSFTLYLSCDAAGTRFARKVGVYQIKSDTVFVAYTGAYLETVDINKLIIPNYSCREFRTIGLYRNQLVLGRLTEDDINYQKYANGITVAWAEEDASSLEYTDSLTFSTKCTFQPDEVYGLYIRLIKTLDGNPTRWFHIPGRVVRTYQREASGLVNEDHTMTEYNAIGGITWAPSATEELTFNGGNAKIFQLRDTSDWGGGLLGFHENENEFYPQDLEDSEVWTVIGGTGVRLPGITNGVLNYKKLQNRKHITGVAGDDGLPVRVRHHKMPTVKSMTDRHHIINLTISNILIPDDILKDICGFSIGIATREGGNISVVGSGLLKAYNSHQVTPKVPLAGSNYTSNLRFVDFGLYSHKPQLNVKYLKVINRLDQSGAVATFGPIMGVNLYDINLVVTTAPNTYTPASNTQLYTINNTKYFPADNLATRPSNEKSESTINIKLDNAVHSFLANFYTLETRGILYTAQIYNYVSSPYAPYYNQKVVPTTGIIHTTGSNSYSVVNMYGGDTTLNKMVDLCTGTSDVHMVSIPAVLEALMAIKFSYHGYVSSEHRKKNEFKLPWPSYTPYIGVAPAIFINPYEYDDEFHRLSNLKSIIAHNPLINYETVFRNRIQKGNPGSREGTDITIRGFTIGKYYDLEKQVGEINKIITTDQYIIIQTDTYTVISTMSDTYNVDEAVNEITKYQQLNSVIYPLGMNDIFERRPIELTPVHEGRTGNKSKFATIVCPSGVLWANREKGIIFLFNGEKVEEITRDYREFFKNNLNTIVDVDNPFAGIGLTMGYDEANNRFIISKLDYTSAVAQQPQVLIDFGGGSYLNKSRADLEAEYVAGTITDLSAKDYQEYELTFYNGEFYSLRAGGTIADDVNITPTSTAIAFTVATSPDCYALMIIFPEFEPGVGNYVYGDPIYMTLSYNFSKKEWISKHSYNPNYMFNVGNYLLSVINRDTNLADIESSIYYHNTGIDVGKFYHDGAGVHTINKSYIDLVFTEKPQIDKILDAIYWLTEVNDSGVDNWDETITHIMAYNDSQCTGLLEVNKSDIDWFNTESGRVVNNSWFFNDFRDGVLNPKATFLDDDLEPNANVDLTAKSWYNQSLLKGNYFIIRLQIDNTTGNLIRIIGFNTIYKIGK